ncbi:hypothetical protein NW762_012053 [Fusarium torreyae]|uniref:Uncharacterized protein n=1 Tax=Fusarium torreyae TaxID=1237075 RepID=A0A9W8RRH0_9HYPO|nr:hypothetical protein NW762_012053 [Fusarium torreyae]
MIKPNPEKPTTDLEISGSLSHGSTVSEFSYREPSHSGVMTSSGDGHGFSTEIPSQPSEVETGALTSTEYSFASDTLDIPAGSKQPTSGDATSGETSGPDGISSLARDTTVLGTAATTTASGMVPGDAGSHTAFPTIATNSGSQLPGLFPPNGTETAVSPTSVVTLPDGSVSIVLPHDSTGAGSSIHFTTSDGHPSHISSSGSQESLPVSSFVSTHSDGQVSPIIPTTDSTADRQGIPTVVTQPDGDVTTISPATQEEATSTGIIVVTGPDGQESSFHPEISTNTNDITPTMALSSDGEDSTMTPPTTEVIPATSVATTNSDGQLSNGSSISGSGLDTSSIGSVTASDGQVLTDFPSGSLTDGKTSNPVGTPDATDSLNTGSSSSGGSSEDRASATNSAESEIASTEIIGTETSDETSPISTDSLTATHSVGSDYEPSTTITISTTNSHVTGTETTDSDATTNPTTFPSAEDSTSSSDEAIREQSDTDTSTQTEPTSIDSSALTSSTSETGSGGEASTGSDQPTTAGEGHSTSSDSKATTDSGRVTTGRNDGKNSEPTTTETNTYVVAPVTTSVSEPEPQDDGFVIPCNMWFFNACIGPISGWGISRPPGTYPPGPPPSISIDPEGGIEINTNKPLPDWPEYTIGPGNIPTFSEEPTSCETESAEMCITSTSYNVKVEATTTSTVTSDVISTCGTIYGCSVQDVSHSVTATDRSTVSDEPPAPTSLHGMENWPEMQESDEDLEAAAEHAQSELDSIFGTSTTGTQATTTEATPTSTESLWTGTCPSLYPQGSPTATVDGEKLLPEGIGEKCLCSYSNAFNDDVEPYTIDQLNDKINDFCDGSRTLLKDPMSGVNKRYYLGGTQILYLRVMWAFSEDNETPKGDIKLGEVCKTAFGRFACPGLSDKDRFGGIYNEVLSQGLVTWTVLPLYTTDGESESESG